MKYIIWIILFVILIGILFYIFTNKNEVENKKEIKVAIKSEKKFSDVGDGEYKSLKNFSRSYGVFVASEKVDCVGVAPMKCLLVRKSWEPKWTYFYDEIKGFDWEEGYEYHLEIKERSIKDPLADASSKEYFLSQVLKKEKKDSDIRKENEKNIFESVWKIEKLNGEKITGNDNYFNFFENNRVSFKASCNGMNTSYEFNEEKKEINFSEKIMSTMMMCSKEISAERELLAAVKNVKFFMEGEKNKLYFLDENREKIIELSR